jgi:hypothetical protein
MMKRLFDKAFKLETGGPVTERDFTRAQANPDLRPGRNLIGRRALGARADESPAELRSVRLKRADLKKAVSTESGPAVCHMR